MVLSTIIRFVEIANDFRTIGVDVSGPALRSVLLRESELSESKWPGLDWSRHRRAATAMRGQY